MTTLKYEGHSKSSLNWWYCIAMVGLKRHIKCNGLTPVGSKKSLPPVLPTMPGSNEQVCVCPRVLPWRWLGKHCHKTHKSYHCCAIPPFRELFWCPSYCKVIFPDFNNCDRVGYIYLLTATNKINMKKTFHHISLIYTNIVRIFD